MDDVTLDVNSVLDAVVVGLGLLIEKGGDKKLPGKKRLWLFSDLESPVKDPDEGTIEDQMATVAGKTPPLRRSQFRLRLRPQTLGMVPILPTCQ
jgi:hypothetical protein